MSFLLDVSQLFSRRLSLESSLREFILGIQVLSGKPSPAISFEIRRIVAGDVLRNFRWNLAWISSATSSSFGEFTNRS